MEMKSILLGALCLLLAWETIAAGPIQWTWEAGKQTNDGSITVKSVSGGSTYSGTQNPTGAVAKTNQNAVTQPPTVVIQATGGSGTITLGITRGEWQGNLGGFAGADAKCVAECGTGWRFASFFDVLGAMGGLHSNYYAPTQGPWVHASNNYACRDSPGPWTTSSSGSTGASIGFSVNNGIGALDTSLNTSCNNTRQILCVKTQ